MSSLPPSEEMKTSAVTPPTSVTNSDLPRPLSPAMNAPSLDGYEILGELGRGGMGVVYKVRQARLERLVAIKVLPEELSRDSAFAERFAREARALARLNHPGIVTVFDFGLADEQSYLVMEYIEGSDLRQRLREGRLPQDEAIRLALQVCDALQYAHEEGVVHRDIKPENILLDRRGRVKIADFGLAKLLTRTALEHTLTRPSQIMGTLHYMAPEQFDNRSELDHRADVYAVGVLLYEMLTGQLPIGRFPPPSETAKTDPRLDAVVFRALERDPSRRYQQVAELRAALESPPVQTLPKAEASTQRPAETIVLSRPVAARIETPEVVRRTLRWPALAMMIVGGLTALTALVIPFAQHGEVIVWLYGNFALPILGVAIIVGGMAAWSGRHRWLALTGAILTVIPFSPAWCVGLPFGIWALVALFRTDVRTAFRERPSDPDDPDALPWRRSVETAVGFALAIALVAYFQMLWPWAALTVFDSYGVGHTLRAFQAYESWRVLFAGLTAFAPVVLLLVPALRHGSSPFRPIVFLTPGVLALLVGSACMFWPGRVDVVGSTAHEGVNRVFLVEANVYRTPIAFEAELRPQTQRESQAVFRGPMGDSYIRVPRGIEESEERLLRRLHLMVWPGSYAALALGIVLTALGLAELWDWFRLRR